MKFEKSELEYVCEKFCNDEYACIECLVRELIIEQTIKIK